MNKKYISDYLAKNAAELPDKDFLVCNDRTLSWSEALAEAGAISAYLAARLSGRQQRTICILLPDSWEFVVTYLGITGSGNIAMPIDITFKKLEVNSVVGSIRPDIIIANRQTQSVVDGPVVLVEDMLAAAQPSPAIRYHLSPDRQVATLFLSSGTTGRPKAIPNTHTNQLWDVEAIAKPMGWTSSDSLLITLHLAHRHGLVICLLGAIFHGNTVYLEERFSAERTLKTLASGKVSIYSTVPAAYEKLVEFEPNKKFDLSRVRLFASSSSTLPPYLQAAFKARFGRDILDRYGTSETGSIAIKTAATKGSFGELLAGVKIKLEKGGEVALKSPGLFPGYLDNQQATKRNITKGGWWLTGDIGEMVDGRLVLKGRSKEKISKSGYSIYPQDVEWALRQDSRVREVKVVGVKLKKSLDDKTVAFYAGDIDKAQLEQYSKTNLPRSWRPDVFAKLDALPRTANGKPKLAKLEQMAREAVG